MLTQNQIDRKIGLTVATLLLLGGCAGGNSNLNGNADFLTSPTGRTLTYTMLANTEPKEVPLPDASAKIYWAPFDYSLASKDAEGNDTCLVPSFAGPAPEGMIQINNAVAKISPELTEGCIAFVSQSQPVVMVINKNAASLADNVQNLLTNRPEITLDDAIESVTNRPEVPTHLSITIEETGVISSNDRKLVISYLKPDGTKVLLASPFVTILSNEDRNTEDFRARYRAVFGSKNSSGAPTHVPASMIAAYNRLSSGTSVQGNESDELNEEKLTRAEALGYTKAIAYSGFSYSELMRQRIELWAMSSGPRAQLLVSDPDRDPRLPPADSKAPSDPLTYMIRKMPAFTSSNPEIGEGNDEVYGKGKFLNFASPWDMGFKDPNKVWDTSPLPSARGGFGKVFDQLLSYHLTGADQGLATGPTYYLSRFQAAVTDRAAVKAGSTEITNPKFVGFEGETLPKSVKEKNLYMGLITLPSSEGAEIQAEYLRARMKELFEKALTGDTDNPDALSNFNLRIQKFVGRLEGGSAVLPSSADDSKYGLGLKTPNENSCRASSTESATAFSEPRTPETPAAQVLPMGRFMQCYSKLKLNHQPLPKKNTFSWQVDPTRFAFARSNPDGSATVWVNIASILSFKDANRTYELGLNPMSALLLLVMKEPALTPVGVTNKAKDLFKPFKNVSATLVDSKTSPFRILVPDALNTPLAKLSIQTYQSLNYRPLEYYLKVQNIALAMAGFSPERNGDSLKPTIFTRRSSSMAELLDAPIEGQNFSAFEKIQPNKTDLDAFELSSGQPEYAYFHYRENISDGTAEKYVGHKILKYVGECNWRQLNPQWNSSQKIFEALGYTDRDFIPQHFDAFDKFPYAGNDDIGCGWINGPINSGEQAGKICVQYCTRSNDSGGGAPAAQCGYPTDSIIGGRTESNQVGPNDECPAPSIDCSSRLTPGAYRPAAVTIPLYFDYDHCDIKNSYHERNEAADVYIRPSPFFDLTCSGTEVSDSSQAKGRIMNSAVCPIFMTYRDASVPSDFEGGAEVWNTLFDESALRPKSTRIKQTPRVDSGGIALAEGGTHNCNWQICGRQPRAIGPGGSLMRAKQGETQVAVWGNGEDTSCNQVCTNSEPIKKSIGFQWDVFYGLTTANLGKFFKASDIWNYRKALLQSYIATPHAGPGVNPNDIRLVSDYLDRNQVAMRNLNQLDNKNYTAELNLPVIATATDFYNSHPHIEAVPRVAAIASTGIDDSDSTQAVRETMPYASGVRGPRPAAEGLENGLYAAVKTSLPIDSISFIPSDISGVFPWVIKVAMPWTATKADYKDFEKQSFGFLNGIPQRLMPKKAGASKEFEWKPALNALYAIDSETDASANPYRNADGSFDLWQRPPQWFMGSLGVDADSYWMNEIRKQAPWIDSMYIDFQDYGNSTYSLIPKSFWNLYFGKDPYLNPDFWKPEINESKNKIEAYLKLSLDLKDFVGMDAANYCEGDRVELDKPRRDSYPALATHYPTDVDLSSQKRIHFKSPLASGECRGPAPSWLMEKAKHPTSNRLYERASLSRENEFKRPTPVEDWTSKLACACDLGEVCQCHPTENIVGSSCSCPSGATWVGEILSTGGPNRAGQRGCECGGASEIQQITDPISGDNINSCECLSQSVRIAGVCTIPDGASIDIDANGRKSVVCPGYERVFGQNPGDPFDPTVTPTAGRCACGPDRSHTSVWSDPTHYCDGPPGRDSGGGLPKCGPGGCPGNGGGGGGGGSPGGGTTSGGTTEGGTTSDGSGCASPCDACAFGPSPAGGAIPGFQFSGSSSDGSVGGCCTNVSTPLNVSWNSINSAVDSAHQNLSGDITVTGFMWPGDSDPRQDADGNTIPSQQLIQSYKAVVVSVPGATRVTTALQKLVDFSGIDWTPIGSGSFHFNFETDPETTRTFSVAVIGKNIFGNITPMVISPPVVIDRTTPNANTLRLNWNPITSRGPNYIRVQAGDRFIGLNNTASARFRILGPVHLGDGIPPSTVPALGSCGEMSEAFSAISIPPGGLVNELSAALSFPAPEMHAAARLCVQVKDEAGNISETAMSEIMEFDLRAGFCDNRGDYAFPGSDPVVYSYALWPNYSGDWRMPAPWPAWPANELDLRIVEGYGSTVRSSMGLASAIFWAPWNDYVNWIGALCYSAPDLEVCAEFRLFKKFQENFMVAETKPLLQAGDSNRILTAHNWHPEIVPANLSPTLECDPDSDKVYNTDFTKSSLHCSDLMPLVPEFIDRTSSPYYPDSYPGDWEQTGNSAGFQWTKYSASGSQPNVDYSTPRCLKFSPCHWTCGISQTTVIDPTNRICHMNDFINKTCDYCDVCRAMPPGSPDSADCDLACDGGIGSRMSPAKSLPGSVLQNLKSLGVMP